MDESNEGTASDVEMKNVSEIDLQNDLNDDDLIDDQSVGRTSLSNNEVIVRPTKKSNLKGVWGYLIVPVLFMALMGSILISMFFLNFFRAEYGSPATWSPSIKTGVLSNGMQYIVRPNPTFKDGRFAASVRVNTGSTNEKDSEQGIAHFTEHMVFDNSRQYKGRAGTWKQIEKADVASFNAFTSFRNTVYMLFDVALSDSDKAMDILYNQVQLAEPLSESVRIEKGAVLGELRYRDSSLYLASLNLFKNHGGGQWVPSLRFPIGKSDIIKSWSPEDVVGYYKRWYRLNKMTLYVAGDFSSPEDERVKKMLSFWDEKKSLDDKPTEQNIPLGVPKPSKKFDVKKIDGINGVVFNMLITKPYVANPINSDDYRHEMNDFIFTYVLTLQIISRYVSNYPDTTIESLQIRNAGAAVQNAYQFGSQLHLLSSISPWQSQSGTWKDDLSVAVTELYNMAENGPLGLLVIALSYVEQAKYQLKSMEDKHKPHSAVVMDLFGTLDPEYVHMDPDQMYEWAGRYSGISFGNAITAHGQTEARFLYDSLMSLADSSYKKSGNIKSTDQVSIGVYYGNDNFITEPADEIPETLTAENIIKVLNDLQKDLSERATPITNPYYALNELLPKNTLDLLNTKLPKPNKEGLKPVKQIEGENPSVKIYELSNGLRVNIAKSQTHSSPSDKNPSLSLPEGTSFIEIVSLGGKSVEDESVRGACEFLNLNKANGLRYYDEQNKNTKSFYGRISPNIECTNNYISVSAYLSPPCFASPGKCKVNDANYEGVLKLLKLSLNPIYTTDSIQSAISSYTLAMKREQVQKEPLNYLMLSTIPELYKKVFPNEPRLHKATKKDFEVLNPSNVQYWVSNQLYSIDRMEINVVGDVNEDNLVKQLNEWFGTIPSNNPYPKVGLNVYDDYNTKFDTIEFPTVSTNNDTSLDIRCNLPSEVESRGYVASIYPAENLLNSNDKLKHLIVDAVLRSYMFDEVRSKNGFGYFAIVRPERLLFKRFSSETIIWAPGDYPENENPTDELNINKSIRTVFNSMKNQISEPMLVRALLEAKSSLLYNMQTNPFFWISTVLRGVSLKNPLDTSKYMKSPSDVSDFLSHWFSNIDEQNDKLNEVQQRELLDYFTNLLNKYGSNNIPRMNVAIRTVDDDSKESPICTFEY